MDEEIKLKFDDTERKIATVDKRFDDQAKRFDDVKWMVGGTSAIFAVIFSVVTIVASWNYNNERANLRSFEDDIRRQVLKIDDTKLDLYGLDGAALAGQTINAGLEKYKISNERDARPDPSGEFHLQFRFIARNTGENSSGPMYIKLYTRTGLELPLPSSDEPGYQYEVNLSPENLDPSVIPGGMSIVHDLHVYVSHPEKISPGSRHPGLLKVYYGRGRITSAPIYLQISAQPSR